MAAARKRRTAYETYGSVAYAPEYGSSVARPLPREEEVLQPRPKARPQTHEQAKARPRVRVREQEQVSVFAVAGFLAVGIFAALVVMSYVRLTTVGDETIRLRSQLSQLQAEESKLLAQYELAYDLKSIEETVTANSSMVRPRNEQIFILDLSEPDSVVLYQQEGGQRGLAGIVAGVKDVCASVVEYFS